MLHISECGADEPALFPRNPQGRPLVACDADSAYRFGLLIRKTEELLLRLFSQGLLSGTTHTCLGQELCSMAVVRALHDPEDSVFSTHRNHGHFLTYSGHFVGLVAEVMGREAGVCGGVGGSQHLSFRHFHSSGVQGGMAASGVGRALALKRRGIDAVTVVIAGDGTTGQGLLYESLNLASIWNLPVLFVVEHNHIAQTTPTAHTIGGSIEARGRAFGLRTWELDDAAPSFLADAEGVVGEIRASRNPGFLVIHTERLGPHSKGDDPRVEAELEVIRARDPLARLGRQLTPEIREHIETAAEAYVREVHRQALASPEAACPAPRRHIFQFADTGAMERALAGATGGGLSVRATLNRALGELVANNPEVLLLGEDLHDPYGGAFKVTAGLSTRFPDRVLSTPISEAGIVGAAIGMAMAGFRPVVEIMFADFVTLAMDQVFNHAVKFPAMFPDMRIPLVVRTPSGGRRGYGPTHSQCPENLLAAVPGLTVVFPSHRHDPGLLLKRAVLGWNSPTFVLEHKLLYGRTVDAAGYREVPAHPEDPGAEWFPVLSGGAEDPDVTLVAYGDAAALAEEAAAELAAEEVTCEVILPSLLSPLPRRTLAGCLAGRPRVVVIEEAPAESGFSAELGAVLLEEGYRGVFRRVAPPPVPVPAARNLESAVLPSSRDVVRVVTETILEEIASSI